MDRDGRESPASSHPADQAEVAYRGFLFSDLRGYTAFVERHGNQAAAELLDAYRELVRAQVAHQHGSEIRTEGDSFYVVFPSAQRAVACGLDIVAAAGRHNQAHPDLPISVGVGIHAGETIERPDGYVGSAVNLAARVCAQARTGEVLVTATVRELTRSGSPVTFTARGSHRLKGVTEAVALFAAHPAGSVAIAVRPARALLLAPVVLIAAIVIGWIALNVARPGVGDASSPLPSTSGELGLRSVSPSASVEPSTGELRQMGAKAQRSTVVHDSSSTTSVITNVLRQRSMISATGAGDSPGNDPVSRQVWAAGSSKWPVTRTCAYGPESEGFTEGSMATYSCGAPSLRVSPEACKLNDEHASQSGSGADGQSAPAEPYQVAVASKVSGALP